MIVTSIVGCRRAHDWPTAVGQSPTVLLWTYGDEVRIGAGQHQREGDVEREAGDAHDGQTAVPLLSLDGRLQLIAHVLGLGRRPIVRSARPAMFTTAFAFLLQFFSLKDRVATPLITPFRLGATDVDCGVATPLITPSGWRPRMKTVGSRPPDYPPLQVGGRGCRPWGRDPPELGKRMVAYPAATEEEEEEEEDVVLWTSFFGS